MPLPPIDHPCMGYVCGVPDGTIPGWTINDCMDAGFSGALAGCIDPQCVGWRPSIPRCGPSVYVSISEPDIPEVDPFSGLLANDMIDDGTGKTGGGGCCCAGAGSGSGFPPGLGPSPADSSANIATDQQGICCDGPRFSFPWWLLLLLVILVFKR